MNILMRKVSENDTTRIEISLSLHILMDSTKLY